MSLLTDIRNISDAAIEELTARFGDVPRPLLAAIGAGDLAAERLIRLREQVGERFGEAFSTAEGMPSRDDVKDFASDLPGKAQKVAGDIARHLEQFASEAPGRAQQLIGELPARAQEFSNSLSPENLRNTIDAYTQLVGQIYGNLAERGGETVAKARTERDRGATRAASEGDAATGPRPAKKPAPKRPAARKPAAKKDEPKKDESKRHEPK